MTNTLKQLVLLIVLASLLGVGRAALLPNGIDLVGKWRDLSNSEGPIIPPTAEEGDPPFIAIDVAQMEHAAGQAIFVDARDPVEFECGTIPGSINIPFDYLPEGDLAPYFDSALGGAPGDSPIIVFCSGEECDLSLHLARNLQATGYPAVTIFFGGAREWEKFDLEMERRQECGD